MQYSAQKKLKGEKRIKHKKAVKNHLEALNVLDAQKLKAQSSHSHQPLYPTSTFSLAPPH